VDDFQSSLKNSSTNTSIGIFPAGVRHAYPWEHFKLLPRVPHVALMTHSHLFVAMFAMGVHVFAFGSYASAVSR
jgi:hypothetical protein